MALIQRQSIAITFLTSLFSLWDITFVFTGLQFLGIELLLNSSHRIAENCEWLNRKWASASVKIKPWAATLNRLHVSTITTVTLTALTLRNRRRQSPIWHGSGGKDFRRNFHMNFRPASDRLRTGVRWPTAPNQRTESMIAYVFNPRWIGKMGGV